MANLGYIGLGAMGSRVVKRLLDAGHIVTGYNRTRSKAQWLLDAGMRWADTPREVAETVDIVFTMVTNTHALHEVTSGADGVLAGLGPGKTYVDMSTVSPPKSRELAAQVAEKGPRILAPTLSPTLITLQQGNLSLIAASYPTP